MHLSVEESQRRAAKNPHELFILNLIGFHLLLAPFAIFIKIGMGALLLPVLLSSCVMTFIYWRARRAEQRDPWFVMAHWKLALHRCRWLLLGYGITGGILLLAFVLTLGMQGHMKEIMFTALTRIGVMPTVILVFVSFVMESNALFQAARGEVPDGLAGRYPPPETDTRFEIRDSRE